MSDRHHVITVGLEENLRREDLEPLLVAIKQLRGVLSVTPHVADHTSWVADERARRELGDKLWEVLYPTKR